MLETIGVISGSGWASDVSACLDYVAMMTDRGVNIVATNNSYGGGGSSQAEIDARQVTLVARLRTIGLEERLDASFEERAGLLQAPGGRDLLLARAVAAARHQRRQAERGGESARSDGVGAKARESHEEASA